MKKDLDLLALYKKGIEIAENILQGKVGCLEGVRLLLSIVKLIEIKSGLRDDDFLVLCGIDSEAEDSFPNPSTKELWNPQAWEKSNLGLHDYELGINEIVQNACRIFIKKYK